MAFKHRSPSENHYVQPAPPDAAQIDAVLAQLHPLHADYAIALSERHIAVLDGYLMGLSYAEIAAHARLSVDTTRSLIREVADAFMCEITDLRSVCQERGYGAER
jgi:DNA-directed RNA polymerase specialized sigma24 family protein